MAARFTALEGPVIGLSLLLEGAEEWTVGRDPESSTLVIADPKVSRQHAIVRLTPEGYTLENLSTTNPLLVNDSEIEGAYLLQEGDRIQIGDSIFTFSKQEEAEIPYQPEPGPEEEPYETIFHVPEGVAEAGEVDLRAHGRYMLKVVSGPNTGAEIGIDAGRTYLIGTDASVCDIVFHDLSVSRQHARLHVSRKEELKLEDLDSRNGTLVGGQPITEAVALGANSIVALGTTSFVVIDREAAQETFIAPTPLPAEEEAPAGEEQHAGEEELVAAEVTAEEPRRGPILSGGTFILLLSSLAILVIVVVASLTLLKTEPVDVAPPEYNKEITSALQEFSDVRFTFNPNTGKLFLLGHVLTPVDKSELLYNLQALKFIKAIDDNIIVDQYVWEEMNNALSRNPEWAGVNMHSPSPGRFVLSGYLQTRKQAASLSDYIRLNFPYLDRLSEEVVVQDAMLDDIKAKLLSAGLAGVTPRVISGEVTLAGYAGVDQEKAFQEVVQSIKEMRGVRVVRNAVVIIRQTESYVDLTKNFEVQGWSLCDDATVNVLIDGRILIRGDIFQGMRVEAIDSQTVILDKDGIKYKINYNQ